MKIIKKILAFALVTAMLLCIAGSAMAATKMYGACTPGTYINVRASAKAGTTVVYKLRNGEPVTYTGTTSNGFKQISSPVEGWVSSDFLSSGTPDWMALYGSATMNKATRTQMIAFQNDLNCIGDISIPVDGYWGPKTEAAVKVVQEKANITVDGIAGTYTKLWVYDFAHRK